MAQNSGARTTNQAITETRLVRNVANKMAELEPNEAAILTFLTKLENTQEVDAPRREWFEDDFVARWTTIGATLNGATGSTSVTVADGTLFAPGDLFIAPQSASSSTVPEIIRVTVVSTNTLTVVRGSSAQTINNGAALRIIGTAYEENAVTPTSKSTAPSAKISYTEIFRNSWSFSRTAMASKTYAAPNGEYEREQAKKLIEHKQQINASFLFGTATESLTGGPNSNPVRTTMGLNSVVTTNVTDASGMLTRKTFETFSASAFRYGSSKNRMLLAAPRVISAIHEWGNSHMQIQAAETVFGVNIQKIQMGHGVWMLVRDWMLEDGVSGKNGFSGWAFSLDMDSLEMFNIKAGGPLPSGQTHLIENSIKDGRDGMISEYLSELGLKIEQEKRFAKLYDVTDYEA